jgi:urease accessory protein
MTALLALLHLGDSLFPIGAYAHSDGLEAATATGLVRTAGDLGAWLDVCLDEGVGRVDGPAVLQAWTAFSERDWAALRALDAEITALRPSAAARQAIRAMGFRLATTWHALHPEAGFAPLLAPSADGSHGPAQPIAFACAAASAGVGQRDAAAAFAYTRLAATISAAMRLMPLGQTDAHAQLARVLDRVPAAIDAAFARTSLESFQPAMDVALMSQPYLESRLFLS